MSFPRKPESRLRGRRALSPLDSRLRGNDARASVIGSVLQQRALIAEFRAPQPASAKAAPSRFTVNVSTWRYLFRYGPSSAWSAVPKRSLAVQA